MRASIKTRIKSYLKRDGDFRKFKWNTETMKEFRKKPLISNFVKVIEAMDPEIREVSKSIKMIAINNETTRILQTLPGVGEFASLLIMAEVGDIRRFDNPKSFVSYCGLGTGTYQSANTKYNVTNNAVNKWLKWIFRMCSGRAVMKSNSYLKHYTRVKNRRGYKIARKSVARKMAIEVWYMMSNNEVYREN
jgi:transposase